MNNKVSFIIPAYNAEKYIGECIESIRKQTISTWELIIVDDGSTDGTAEICIAYTRVDDRIKVIQQQNAGSAVARNAGLDIAEGDWIAFIDADDWIEKNYLETLHSYMNLGYDFIMYSYYEVHGIDKKSMCNTKSEMVLEKEIFRLMILDVIDTERRVLEIATSRSQFWTKVFRRDFLIQKKLRIDPELRMSQDVMFNLCVYNNAQRGVFIPQLLYNYRVLDDSTCHRYSIEQVPRILKLTEAIGKYVDKLDLGQEGKLLFQKRILVSLVNACRLDFCHGSNPAEYAVRRKNFLHLCDQEPFSSALTVDVIRRFSLKKQICMWFVKFRCFGLLCVFLRKK